MTPSMIALLSWIPFLLVALICGLTFSFRGYKRGAACAGISIGVTILSSVFSILVAKLLSGSLAGVLRPLVSDMLRDLGESEAITRLSDAVTQALCATVLYLPVFLLLAIVLKCVASAIFKRILPKPEKTLNRVGGLAISIGDALVFALLLLIPLYGTLALGGHVVTAMNAAEGEDLPEEMLYLEALTDTFLSNAAGSGPLSAVYDSLTTVSTGGESLCVSGAVRSTSQVVVDFVALTEADSAEEREKLASRMADELDSLVSKNTLLVSAVGDLASEKLPDVGGIHLTQMYPRFENTDHLKNDLSFLIDLAKAMVESGFIDALQAEGGYDASKVDMNHLADALGKALNASESLATLKSSAIREALGALTKELDDDMRTEAVKELLDAVESIPSTPLSEEDAKKEGEALVMILQGITAGLDKEQQLGEAAGSILEGLARHPSVGVDKVVDAAGALLSTGGAKLSDSALEPLKDALRESVNKPLGESTFPTLADTAFDTVEALDKVAHGNADPESMKEMISSDKNSLLQMKDIVTDELVQSLAPGQATNTVVTLINTVFDALIENPLSDAEIEAEAQALSSALVIFNEVANASDPETLMLDSSDRLIEACLSSRLLTDVIAELTEGSISDPLNLFGNLRQDVRVTLNEKIDNHTTAQNATAAYNLKLFIGVA